MSETPAGTTGNGAAEPVPGSVTTEAKKVELRDYAVKLGDREYPTYPGVLALAHERGLQSIETALVQIPGPDNDHTAIAKAVVTMKDGTRFEEFGDASPRNVNARIATAIIRMSMTRAKGRALRDAVNVGETLADEIPDETPHATMPDDRPRAPYRPAESSGRGNGNPSDEGGQDRPLRCSIAACGKELKPAQATFSRQRFDNRLLCPSCQEKVGRTP